MTTGKNYSFDYMDHKDDWAPKNWCFWIVVLEKTLESPLDCKEIKPVNPKGSQPWIFIGRTELKLKLQYFGYLIQRADLFEKTLILGLRAGGEEDNRGWDGWTASPTQWTWVWVGSGSWWWTGRPGVLRFMGSHGHDWATELNWSSKLTSYSCVALFVILGQEGTLNANWMMND